jgi:hypothetical protein
MAKAKTTASVFALQDVQKVPYSIPTPLDADGNPTALPAGDSILVTSDTPAVASVVPDATPSAGNIASGFILGGTTEGLANVTFQAVGSDGVTPDATIGPFVQPIQVGAGPATQINATLGTPVAQ